MNLNGPPPEFVRICSRNGLVFTEGQIEMFSRFVAGVLDWNSRINLISRRDEENIWFGHVLHSLSLLFYVEIPDTYRILDLGTGGGFPGIPIAIARPGAEFVLLDSIRKKTTAVQNIVERLGLTGVSVWNGRAEEVYRQAKSPRDFDVVLARGVASLRDLIRWARPYLKRSGGGLTEVSTNGRERLASPALVALKGGDLEGEIAEARTKESPGSIRVIRLSFDGSTELGLEDKKIVIAHL